MTKPVKICFTYLINRWIDKDATKPRLLGLFGHSVVGIILKLYCGYKYTRPNMINRIWGLNQLWLQVNGHAWLH